MHKEDYASWYIILLVGHIRKRHARIVLSHLLNLKQIIDTRC